MEGEQEEEKQAELLKRMKVHKYIGETSRSVYERGLEHLKDLEDMKVESHMLKHYQENHEDEEIRGMEFGMKIDHHILNSMSEYNRCALPRLATRIGEESLEKIEKLRREEKKSRG